MYHTVRFIHFVFDFIWKEFSKGCQQLRFAVISIRNKAYFARDYKWSFLVTVKKIRSFCSNSTVVSIKCNQALYVLIIHKTAYFT